MIKDLEPNNIEKSIQSSNYSVLLYWAKGCQACEQTKPLFEEMSDKFTNIDFYSMPLSENSFDFYKKYAEEIQSEEVIMNKNNEPIKDEEGIPKTKLKFDENNEPIMEPKIVIPNFFVFTKDSQSKENQDGFIGSFDGLRPEQLRDVLIAIDMKISGVNFV